jgi:hypothetical protein
MAEIELNKIALFIDGANLYSTAKTLGLPLRRPIHR